MTEIEKLKRDIDGIFESNRLEWLELANDLSLTPEQVLKRKTVIFARSDELRPLMERYFELKSAP